jgi:hypothetical protein
MEGKEVKRLMRVHNVTIRELSRRMQITQKQIRQIREIGLDNPNVIRDWLQGILGSINAALVKKPAQTSLRVAVPCAVGGDTRREIGRGGATGSS